MRVVWRIRVISTVYRRSRSVRWKTTCVLSTRHNRLVSASSCWGCRRYARCRHRSSSSCSSCDWSARRRLTLWYATCCSAAARSTGSTCPFSDSYHCATTKLRILLVLKCVRIYHFTICECGVVMHLVACACPVRGSKFWKHIFKICRSNSHITEQNACLCVFGL